MENRQLAGKVCVVTGGALGIGRCLTHVFALQGADVAFIDLNAQAGAETERMLMQEGARTLFYAGDVAKKEELEAFTRRIEDCFGGVDFLINNACLTKGGIHSGCGWEEFDYVQRVGVVAPYYLTKLLLPLFRPGASIVNISSTRASMSQADTESYTAAKGGIAALTHGLAVSLAGRVRVNAVSPGWIDVGACHDPGYKPLYSRADKEQHPAGRVGDPDDIARAVLFLCDERNSFITGANLTIDGGMTRRMIYDGDEGWRYRP